MRPQPAQANAKRSEKQLRPKRFFGRRNLLKQVVSSGFGRTPKTAFKVISVTEEYSLLADFGAEVIGQSQQDQCDVMRCKLPDGKEGTYYFDASIALAAEAHVLTPAK